MNDFILLGSTINIHLSKEIRRRIALGKSAVNGLSQVLKSKDVSLRTKICLIQAVVFSIALYGSESWMMNKEDRQGIDGFELGCWRRMLNVPWTGKRTYRSVC